MEEELKRARALVKILVNKEPVVPFGVDTAFWMRHIN